MEISKKYEPGIAEDRWYAHWIDQGFFHSVPDGRPPFTIVIPPPNVTGILHMGHMLNNTIQDVLVRRARMLGFNACWVPGTDHASIATEAKVVAKLEAQGIKKTDLTREEFLKHAWEWKEKHGGIILAQLKKLGASCDWERTRFTMDEKYYESVILTFVDLHNKGLIYRGVRMVNWDPSAKTAVSDEEVIYREVNSKLFHVRYKIEGTEDQWITIATTRPETILGDTGICVHPDDERYKNLVGKKAIVPIVNRPVPIVADEHVEMEFGTGCLKVTPAHDINDYNLGIKYNLEVIDILNEDGTLSPAAGHYIGEDRFVVRKKIVKDLDASGNLVKEDDYINKVGYSERTDAAIEPRLSMQWFCKTEQLSKPALECVMNDEVQFHPAKFKNSYRHWMENIKDWCISRQLWWGHRIPAWYYGAGANDFVVALNVDKALVLAKEASGNNALSLADLRQDEDVLDTWFSSWLWPISVFDGFFEEGRKELDYYYPTNDLVTAPEIMFFWVARMIMAGFEYKQGIPFRNVYFTGIVRDKLGRKMSKQLGNSPDPIELIGKHGADGVRVGMLLSSPAGNDLLFDMSSCEQGRNFTNKIWNAFRLITSWEVVEAPQPDASVKSIDWFRHKFNAELAQIEDHYSKFRMSDALMSTYKLIWDDFCSWYLELVKPEYQQPIDRKTLTETLAFFEDLLKVVHPFTPFVTEEIYHLLEERLDSDCIMVSSWPKKQAFDQNVLTEFEAAMQVVSSVRTIRNEQNIANKIKLELFAKVANKNGRLDSVIVKMANLAQLAYTEEKISGAFGFVIHANEYFVPFSEEVDVEAEIQKLEEELKYTQGFLTSVEKKLQNERFVSNAPEPILAAERNKQSDALAKIKILGEKIAAMKE